METLPQSVFLSLRHIESAFSPTSNQLAIYGRPDDLLIAYSDFSAATAPEVDDQLWVAPFVFTIDETGCPFEESPFGDRTLCRANELQVDGPRGGGFALHGSQSSVAGGWTLYAASTLECETRGTPATAARVFALAHESVLN